MSITDALYFAAFALAWLASVMARQWYADMFRRSYRPWRQGHRKQD